MAERCMQRDLWGNVVEPKSASVPAVMRIEFNDSRLRIVMKGTDPWWVIDDVAKLLGYSRGRDAARILRDRQKGAHFVRTPGGEQEMTIISEGGLYRLIMRSRSPVADEFQDWVTDEVLPTIRKTGRYGLTVDRIDQAQRQTKGDRRIAEVRVKVKDANVAIKARVRRSGGCVNDEIASYQAVYDGLFDGHTAGSLRREMGLKPHVSPLDRMSEVCLSTTLHSKIVAARLIEERGTAIGDQAETYKTVARGVLAGTLHQLGSNRQIGFRETSRRGTILDVLDAAS